MKKLLFLMLLLAAALPRAAADTTVTDEVFIKDGIMYHVLPDNTLEVVNGTGVNYEGDIVIPSHVTNGGKSRTVTRLGNGAFSNNPKVHNVTIPNTVDYIDQAFIASGIRRISIPASVKFIVDNAFRDCKSMKEFILEDSREPVSMQRMDRCDSLEYIYKGRDITVRNPPERTPFSSKNIQRLDISDCVTKIAYMEFWDCTKLKKVVLPNSVKVVEDQAFNGCSALEEINLGQVDSIGCEAFRNTASNRTSPLKKLVVPGSVKHIAKSGLYVTPDTLIFEYGPEPLKLTAYGISYLDSIKYVELNRDIEDGFGPLGADCVSSLRIGEGVTRIPHRAFADLGKKIKSPVETPTLPSTLKTIGNNAFNGCKVLGDIVLPASLDSIGETAFMYSSIKSLGVNTQLIDTIGERTFYGSSLESVDLRNSALKAVGNQAFMGCRSLKNLVFNNEFSHIDKSSFEICTALEGVVLPDSLRYVGYKAFRGCENAFADNTINFQDNIEHIDDEAFFETNLNKMTFSSEKYLNIPSDWWSCAFPNLDFLVFPLNSSAYEFKLNKNGHAYCLLSEPVADLNLSASYSPAYLHVPVGSADKYNAKYSLKNITIVDDLVAEGPRGVTADGQLVVTVECQPFAEGAELRLYADEEKSVDVGRAVAMASGDSRAGRLLTFRLDGLTTYDELHYRLSPIDDKGVKIALTTGTIKVNDPSAIDGIEADADDATAPDAVYDLQGRRLSAPQRGVVNIVNGRKVLVR